MTTFTAERRAIRRAVFVLGMVAAGCGYDSRYPTSPSTPTLAAASISLGIADTSIDVGQSTQASAILRDQFGAPFNAAVAVFTSTNPEIAGVSRVDGRILGLGQGTTTIIAAAGELRATQTVTVRYPEIFINEVFPLGKSNAGWVELYNPTAHGIDLSGWFVTNANGAERGVMPEGTSIPAGGFLIIDEPVFPLGLGSKGFVRLFSKFGIQSDAFAWGHDPINSYGRCPDGETGLGETTLATKGGPNLCA